VFQHEGPTRSVRKNGVLAGYLAFVAGFVNSVGFILIGRFTSHVTGVVGAFGIQLSGGDLPSALTTLLLVVNFFAGAFVASLLLETSRFGRTSAAYGTALLVEAAVLAAFVGSAGASYLSDARPVLLAFAMGMQNSLVTRLSGAVVRTTHLTGVITDLGIEAARWYRWHRAKLRALPPLLPSRSPPDRPVAARALLLSTIVGAFTLGAMCGASAARVWRQAAVLVPVGCLVAASLYAFREARRAQPQSEG
jgi:uncharacterized membrane protein YoaK (UPF0700 family)